MARGPMPNEFVLGGKVYVNCAQAAEAVGLSEQHLRERCRGGTGKLKRGKPVPFIKKGYRYFFNIEELTDAVYGAPAQAKAEKKDKYANLKAAGL